MSENNVASPSRETASGTAALVQQSQRPLIPVRSALLPSGSPIAGLVTSPRQLDAFRELRTRLQAMAASVGHKYFTTLVVSANSKSGASFICRNLAAAFTLQEEATAILIDCNIRQPTQHIALGVRAEDGGLFDYLDERRSSLDMKTTAVPQLHLIPAGRAQPVAREYFSCSLMRNLMEGLRRSSCFVFLDGPTTKGSPDARILADQADFVVLVAGYAIDTVQDIAEAASLFDPKKFAGVVFHEDV